MRNVFISIFLLVFLDLTFQRCANIASPTGGPRDTIPPILLETNPINGSINYKEQEFTLSFSEFIKADKIQQQLIITPRTENKYKTTIKKNTVILKFEDPFEDSTTYNFNFADGITDITESNPAVNLSLAFSTGNFIDSLSIQGEVIDLFKQEEAKGYLVGLYPTTDSLDYFVNKPTYFTTTNDSGKFKLNYLKSGIYNLLVFNDDNRNVTFDPETEQHGFVKDSILLDSSIQLVKPIATLLQNIKPINFINSRPTGPYIELKYSKSIDTYNIEPSYIQHSLTGESKDVIRIYKSENMIIGDSISIISSVYDSLNNTSIDTIKTAFIESNRKPSNFSFSAVPSDSYLSDTYSLSIAFNKPVYIIDSTKIYLKNDSLFKQAIDTELEWNHNHTLLSFNPKIDRLQLIDTIRSFQPKDTSKAKIINAKERPGQERPGKKQKPLQPIELILDTATFVSIENDSSQIFSLKIPLEESTAYGTIKLTCNTDKKSFIVQLLNGSQKVMYSSRNMRDITFQKVSPAKYSIRVLIDNNEDGKWSAGNLLLNSIPEEIYLHDEETVVRENWVLEIDISF